MIKIDIDNEEFKVCGDALTICSEISVLFKKINEMLDSKEYGPHLETMEEAIVVSKEEYDSMVKLTDRLKRARIRVEFVEDCVKKMKENKKG